MSEVISAYSRLMPTGQAFNGLEWCSVERSPGPPFTQESVWRVPNTSDFLLVRITNDPQAPTLTIVDDRGNIARKCQ